MSPAPIPYSRAIDPYFWAWLHCEIQAAFWTSWAEELRPAPERPKLKVIKGGKGETDKGPSPETNNW